MHVGDAATFAISADSIAKMGAQMPPFIKQAIVKLYSTISKCKAL